MSKTKRILHVLGTTNLGGAESRIMDLYRHLNKEEFQFDFLVHTTGKGHFDDEIESLGGHVYRLPAYKAVNYVAYVKACKSFFENHHDFIAVHGHMTSTASIYLPIAKKAGIPLTIAHARSAGVDKGAKGYLTKLLRKNLYKKTDVMIACSDLAAEAVFGKKRYQDGNVIIMPNAIDTKQFTYNEIQRQEVRKTLNLENKFVIGHVGRFHYAKNHEFLIKIFQKVASTNPNARLLLIGDGPLRTTIEEQVRQLGLEGKVIFMGNQTPIAPFYQAMDIFVFPSRFEGMPGTVVEAQAAGLRCLVSDTITKEVKATDLVEFISINVDQTKWSDRINELSISQNDRGNVTEQLIRNGFDVNTQIDDLTKLYLPDNAIE